MMTPAEIVETIRLRRTHRRLGLRLFKKNIETLKYSVRTLAICCVVMTVPVQGQDLPEGPGKDVVVKACTSCHGVDNFTSKRNTREDWKSVVETMIGYGAEVTPEQSEIIVNYLTKYFGKEAKVARDIASSRQWRSHP